MERTVASLQSVFGAKLEGALLVGAAMSPAHQHRGRAPEIVAVVTDGGQDLGAVARGLHGPMSEGARLRLLTRRELERSCDVFALEIAEWKARHHLLHGEDVLAGLTVHRADLRRGLETELRGLGRRIKNRVLTGLATDGKRDDPHQAIVDGIDRLVVAAHHSLVLLGASPPPEEPATLRALAAKAGADAEPLLGHLARLRGGETRFDALEVLVALLALVEPAIELVDGLAVEP